MFLYFLVSPIVYFPHKYIFILSADLIPCVLFCHTLFGSQAHLCNFIRTHLVCLINELRKTARLAAPIQSAILCYFFIEPNINQQIQIRAAESFNQRRVSAANRVAMEIRIWMFLNSIMVTITLKN